MKIAIGSANPVKLKAVRYAFLKVWPGKNINIISVNTDSGVSDQPMSDRESIKGAVTRAKNALKESDADFGVGLEGGQQQIEGRWYGCGWIAIVDKNGEVGVASSPKIETPAKIIKLLKKGMELGDADDFVFGKKNSKQKGGYFSLVTNNKLSRKQAYATGVISALARFISPFAFK